MIVKRTTTYAVCPSCGKDAGTVDHLLGIAVVKTAWYCDHCGERYSLDFKADGSVQIEQMPGERIVKTFDVLRLPPQDKDVYFIVSGMRFEPGENHAEYFYESHSCPTNWLRPEMVYHDGDSDPHGLIKFVARRDQSEFPEDEPVGPNAHDDALVKFVEESK